MVGVLLLDPHADCKPINANTPPINSAIMIRRLREIVPPMLIPSKPSPETESHDAYIGPPFCHKRVVVVGRMMVGMVTVELAADPVVRFVIGFVVNTMVPIFAGVPEQHDSETLSGNGPVGVTVT